MALQTPVWDFQQPQYLAALRNFISLNDPRAQVLLTAAPANRFKLQVSTLGLSDVVGANGLAAAAPTAWRYMAETNGHAVAVELALNTPRITTLIEGTAADQAFQALAALQRNDTLPAVTFGVVHLRIAGARVESYWLRSSPAGAMGVDRVVPFSTPLNNTLKPTPEAPTIWAPTDFLIAIKSTAETDLKFYGSDLKAPRKVN
ncbi:MAG TPA: hypothetical protein VH640_08405 [Bryobacteraceae bacterium]